MPIIKSAIKKMRKDRKRTKLNRSFITGLKKFVKVATAQKSPDKIKKAVSTIDKAVKKNLLNKNTAGRMKSKLAKLVKSDVSQKEEEKLKIKKKKAVIKK